MNYYLLDNENIIPLGNDIDIAKDTIEHMPQYKDYKIMETLVDIVLFENKYYLENDPIYIEKKKEAEKERIANLTCTKRVLVLMLEELGLDYFEQIEPLINSNRQAKLEWELAIELLRSNPLIDIIGSQLGISSEQIDLLFKYANGEITMEEFMPTVKGVENV